MSGLFGYFCRDYNEHIKDMFIKIIQDCDYNVYENNFNRNSNFSCSAAKSDGQEKSHKLFDKSVEVNTSGVVYNDNINNMSEAVLTLYKRGDLDLLKNFNGSFLGAIYDSKQRKVVLINDRYGSIRLYYYFDGSHFYFAPKLRVLLQLGATKKLKTESVYDFFLFGYPLGNKTLLQDIFLLPPASILEVGQENLRITRYWDFDHKGEYDPRPQGELAEELNSLWQKSIERRVDKDSPNLILISGGIDSRAILAAALKCVGRDKIYTATFGAPGLLDFDLGRLVAERAGVNNLPLPVENHDFKNQYLLELHDSEGMIDATPYSVTRGYKRLREYGRSIISGYMGGELMGPLIFAKIAGLDPLSRDGFNRAGQIILDHHRLNRVEEVKQLCDPDSTDNKNILSSFEKTLIGLNKVSEKDLPTYCAAWLYKHENDKYTSFCNFKYRNIFDYTFPFLDNDLVDFMLRTNPVLRIDKKLYKSMLLKFYPDLFMLPAKNTYGLKLNTNHFFLLAARCFLSPQRYINKIATRIIKRNVLFNQFDNYIDYANNLRTNEEFHGFIKNLIIKFKKRDFLNNIYIDKLWESHMRGMNNHINLLCLLATLELFIEEFVDK